MATTTKERPILFSEPMVRAILDGRKTQTRRVVAVGSEFQPSNTLGYDWTFRGTRRGGTNSCVWQDLRHAELMTLCPYGATGDRLYVRETWRETFDIDQRPVMEYRAGGTRLIVDNTIQHGEHRATSVLPRWRPSIFMPRWASRITLEITGIRVERVQQISEQDAQAEGVSHWSCGHPECCDRDGTPGKHYGPRSAFMELWDQINSKRGFAWESNPWVWVIEFKRVEKS